MRARFCGLTAFAAETEQRVEPSLAESWTSNRTSTRFTFTLRSDARFSDGSVITARDVVDSLERLVRKATRSPHAFVLASVAGYDEAVAGRRRRLDGLRAEGPRTIVFTLRYPFAELPVFLSHPAAVVIPSAARTSGRFGADVASSGPFVATEVVTDSRIVFERDPDAVGATAYLDGFEILAADDPALLARSGNADVAYLAAGERGSASADLWATVSFGINIARFPDARTRRVFAQTFDRRSLSRSIEGRPTGRLVPAALLRADPVPPPAADIEAARAAWRNAPHPDRKIRVYHLDDPQSVAAGQRLVADLRAAGIPANGFAITAAQYPVALGDRDYDLVQLGWLSEIPSPDGFLAGQLLSSSPDNQNGWKDRGFDDLISQARATRDPVSRVVVYRRAETRALQAAAMVAVFTPRVELEVTDQVEGLLLDGSGTFDPAAIWRTT